MCEPAAYQFSIGSITPFPAPIFDGLWARLIVDAAVPILVATMARPAHSDVGLIATGNIDVALDQEGQSAILLWRFSCPGMPTMVFDTPLNVGLEDVREFPNLSIRDLAPGEQRSAVVVLQDEIGVVRLIRNVVMPRPILDGLAPLLVRQLAHRGTPKLVRRHVRDIERYYARMPDPAKAYHLAPIKGRAA